MNYSYIESIESNKITVDEIERVIYEKVCEAGRDFTRELLEEYDLYLMNTRDKKMYRHKGKTKSYIHTIYGKVCYKRNVYEKVNQDGTTSFIYLLDSKLGVGSNHMSENLQDMIRLSVEKNKTYGKTAQDITAQTCQKFSKQDIWRIVQSFNVQKNDVYNGIRGKVDTDA